MQRSLLFTVFIMALLSLTSVQAGPANSTTKTNTKLNIPNNHQVTRPLNSIVAIVNNGIITQSQLDKQLALINQQLLAQKRERPAPAILRKQVLNQLIDQQLQLQMAKKEGITITNTQLDAALADIAAQNHMNISTLKQQVEKRGLSYVAYRNQIRQQLLMNGVQRQAVIHNIKVSNQELQNAIKSMTKQMTNIPEYHLQAILVPVDSTPTPTQVDAAKQKAIQLVSQLKKGANFGEVAISDSAGKQALQGGDMGWKQLTQLPPPIAAQVSAATVGSIVGPIQSPHGFYILKVVAERSSSVNNFVTLVHVRRILLKQEKLKNVDKVKAKLDHIRAQIIKGKSFAKMAAQYSQDKNSASKGGDSGWITPQAISASFAQTIKHLHKGQISQPIQTKKGWEIIQVLGQKRVNTAEKNIANRVRQMLFERKFMDAVQTWVQQLRGDAYIKIIN